MNCHEESMLAAYTDDDGDIPKSCHGYDQTRFPQLMLARYLEEMNWKKGF